jgi:glycerophosphoryl diester phosphodiesterase
MKLPTIGLALVALAAVTLSLTNASWIAAKPSGPLILVAHRGIIQPFDRAAVAPGECSARAIRASGHLFIENTLFSIQNAFRFGARGLALDVRTSSDGHAILFRDATLDCRTNGTGAVRERPLAYLKSLDAGYGYSADGGATFPLRGRGIGAMATAEELIRAYPRERLIFELHDPQAADAILAAFAAAGVAIGPLHGFAGDPAALARLRQRTQAGWKLDRAASESCLSGYRATGWLGIVPESCRGATLILPRGGGWTLWGWPYRFLSRMSGVGATFFVGGDSTGGELAGLDRAEQLGEVPRAYAGLLLVDDMHDVGRALRR